MGKNHRKRSHKSNQSPKRHITVPEGARCPYCELEVKPNDAVLDVDEVSYAHPRCFSIYNGKYWGAK